MQWYVSKLTALKWQWVAIMKQDAVKITSNNIKLMQNIEDIKKFCRILIGQNLSF